MLVSSHPFHHRTGLRTGLTFKGTERGTAHVLCNAGAQQHIGRHALSNLNAPPSDNLGDPHQEHMYHSELPCHPHNI